MIWAVTLGIAVEADAQSPQDVKEFERFIADAQDSLEQGDFEEARRYLLRAEEIFAHPSISLRIATAEARTGRCTAAAERLDVLAERPIAEANPEQVASLNEEVARCAPYGWVKVMCEPEDADIQSGDESFPCGQRRQLNSGEHQLKVSADGFEGRNLTLVVEEGEVATSQVALRAIEPAGGPSPKAIAGWGLGVGGVGLIGSALAIDATAASRQVELIGAARAGEHQRVEELEARASRRRAQVGVMMGLGAAALAAGGVLIWHHHMTDSSSDSETLSLEATASGMRILVRW